jgi:hypothetical protein
MPEANYYGVQPTNVKDVEGRYRYVATASQTAFAANYAPGFVDVFYNGVKLDPGTAFTAVDGTSVVLSNPATANVIVEIISKRQVKVFNSGLDSFATPHFYTATSGQTSFSLTYTAGSVLFVTRNGLDVAFTASNGTSVVLGSAATTGDIVKIYTTALFNVANALPLNGGTLSGPIALTAGGTSVTPTAGDNSTVIATTAFVQNSFAPLASPTFTGSPKAVTQAAVDNSTNIATTAFVQNSFAPLASPTFTGSPKAVTQTVADNSTNIATTAFTQAALNSNVAGPVPFSVAIASGAATITIGATSPVNIQSQGSVYKVSIPSGTNIVLPATASLGATSGVSSRIVVLWTVNNPGLMVVNLSGSTVLDETNSISPVAISGSATSATVVYSASGTIPTPYKIIGVFDAVWTSGTGWSSPTLLACVSTAMPMASMASIGYGQTWQSPARSVGTTYYNTTNKPILVSVAMQGNSASTGGSVSISVNGVTTASQSSTVGGSVGLNTTMCATTIVPPGASYLAGGGTSLVLWSELR